MVGFAVIGSSVAAALLAACIFLPRGEVAIIPKRPTSWLAKLTSASYVKLVAAPGDGLLHFYLSGELPPQSALDLREHNSIDAVWFYVNGSDVRHTLAHAFYRTKPVGYHVPLHLEFPGDIDLIQQESSLLNSQSTSLRHYTSSRSSSISNRFRDNGELLYSLRSARRHMKKSLGTQYLVTTDFWTSGLPVREDDGVDAGMLSTDKNFLDSLAYWSGNEGEVEDRPGESQRSSIFRVEDGLLRYGQAPQWLNLSSTTLATSNACQMGTKKTDLILCHDWQLAASPMQLRKEYEMSQATAFHNDLQWKLAALPTFNSMSAEAVLSLKMDNLSEAFIYSNDDMFFGRDMAASDFYTPLFGPVLRMSTRELIEEDEHPEEVIGEGPSILWSNWLLSKRFGLKRRPWFYHFQKTYTKLAILESRLMWADSFESAVMHRFRGDGRMANSHFLTFHYLIEKHREALLWSFFILKWKSGEGAVYTDKDLKAIRRALGSTDEHQRPVSVKMPIRTSLDVINDELVKTHILKPKNTEYVFTSMDGSANTQLPFKNPDKPWPSFEQERQASQREACVLDIGSCWPIGSRSPDQVFKHFAFARPECGDCAIVHLVGQSGALGLSAFLPEGADKIARDEGPSLGTFHLPLENDWRQCDFSLPSVLRQNDIVMEGMMPSKQDMAVSLLHRYAYVIGESHSFYASLQSNEGVAETINKLEKTSQTGATPALLCLNDDLGEAGEVWDRDNITSQLSRYFESVYPDPLPYERRALADDEEDPDDV